jgi:TolB-like protein
MYELPFSRPPTHAVLVSGVGALAFVASHLAGESAASSVPRMAPTPAGAPIERTRALQTTLAVLPFDTWSEDPDDDAFSDTLTRETIDMLTREGVRVAPYAVVEQFKSQMVRRNDLRREIPRIADTLGATAVVLGTVTRESDGVLLVSINLFDGERGELLCGSSVKWQGPRTGRRTLREYVVPQIVSTLNR